MHRPLYILSGFLVLGLSLGSLPANGQATERLAPLLDGLGDLHHPVTTDVPMAQRFFDQGLVLSYAFNHAEAARAFREAIRLDPTCAMCHWGLALVLGPNINATMEPADVPEAYQAAQKAVALARTPKERAYVQALGQRYVEQAPEDRTALDRAYAEAMRALANAYPEDDDARTLFAEALMDTTPWDYWEADGRPKAVTTEILATLETVFERAPSHPGANHLYIHAVEAVHPEMGIAAADRLGDLVPGAGHLVHMPGHIYIRVGRYHDASMANERAIAADDAYATQCHAQGLYPLAYMPHNHHFLWAAATLEGRRETALGAARHIAAHVDPEQMRMPGLGTLQHFFSTPLYALIRFGQWDEILQTPAPDEDLLYPTGVWHYARGVAFARKGQLEAAAREWEALRVVATDPVLESVTIWDLNTTADLLTIAGAVLFGEIAAAQGNVAEAIAYFEEGVQLEDALTYDEPAPWHHPVRQLLGAVLLENGRATDAEQVYQADLERYPENGWSLYGLHQSLLAQGKTDEAAAVKKRFEAAWRYADVTLTSSRF